MQINNACTLRYWPECLCCRLNLLSHCVNPELLVFIPTIHSSRIFADANFTSRLICQPVHTLLWKPNSGPRSHSLKIISNSVVVLGKGAKKIFEKKITNVGFAFTHTYTPVKTNIFSSFPQSYMENFEEKKNNKCYFCLYTYIHACRN